VKVSALIGAALLGYGAAHASDWVPLGKDLTGGIFVDVSSVRATGHTRQAWSKFYPTQKKTVENKMMSFLLTLRTFDCLERKSREEAMTAYFNDGTTDTVPAKSFPSEWTPVQPDSYDEAQMELLCGSKPSGSVHWMDARNDRGRAGTLLPRCIERQAGRCDSANMAEERTTASYRARQRTGCEEVDKCISDPHGIRLHSEPVEV
jgi:hypothetical protein